MSNVLDLESSASLSANKKNPNLLALLNFFRIADLTHLHFTHTDRKPSKPFVLPSTLDNEKQPTQQNNRKGNAHTLHRFLRNCVSRVKVL